MQDFRVVTIVIIAHRLETLGYDIIFTLVDVGLKILDMVHYSYARIVFYKNRCCYDTNSICSFNWFP